MKIPNLPTPVEVAVALGYCLGKDETIHIDTMNRMAVACIQAYRQSYEDGYLHGKSDAIGTKETK